MNRLRLCSSYLVLLFALGSMLAVLTGVRAFSEEAPSNDPAERDDDAFNWAVERNFWSFRRPVAHAPPAVLDERWPSQPLDYFVLAQLERKRLSPSPEADKRTLIRRATFDITGLPPTPKEVEEFIEETGPESYARVVERLLSSPRFGERMASVWLPLARYAEDQAHQVGDDTKFFYPNAHKYRDWVIDAFNRDLPYDEFVRLQLAADFVIPRDPCREHAVPEDVAALGFLGLGPKYYNRNETSVMADEWEDRVDTVTRAFLGLTVACARCHDHKFDPISTRDYYAMAGVFASTRMVNKTLDGVVEKDGVKAEKMDPRSLHIVEDGSVADLNVLIRGNVARKGAVAARRFLRILSEEEPAPFHEGSGRGELADAIANRENPLTARVMVNRLWGTFFGRPLVPTPSNFGNSGLPPTHPELLDDLAVRFMEAGWSIKTLVKEMVLSSTYRQSSLADSARLAADAPNDFLSRMNRRRLTIEQWRDTALFVAGELTSGEGRGSDLSDPDNRLRTVYARVSRMKLNDILMQFDYPDANVHAEKRSVTTTPMQKLFMLNSSFVQTRAKALAARLKADSACHDETAVQTAYHLVYGREPDQVEMNMALEFLHKPAGAEMSRWQQYAQILLASNELLYVD